MLAQSYDWVVNAANEAGNSLPAGGLAGYNISVVNNSSTPAPSTVINIPFTSTPVPGIAVFDQASGDFTGCAVGGTPARVSCTVPALGANATANATLRFRTSAAGVLVVVPDIPAMDANVNNNRQTVTTTIIRGTDLGLVITGPATAPAGSRQNYSFTTTNLGPDVSDSFQVRFPVPTGLGAITAPTGCVLSGSDYLCTSSTTLAVNASRTFAFAGTIGAAFSSAITLTASLQNQQPADANPANTTAIFTTSVTAGSDVAITKARSPTGTLSVGTTVTFTLTPSYSGDVPNGLTITDTLPINYTNISAPSGNGWACSVSGRTVTCTQPSGTVAGVNVPLGVVTISARANSAGNPTNTAVIASASPTDPNLSNNTATDGGATITADTIDLRISKTGPNPPTVVQGQDYLFNLGAANIGTVAYTGPLVIKEIVPAGMSVTSIGGSGYTCVPSATTAVPVVGPATITCTRNTPFTQADPLGRFQSTGGINVVARITGTGPIGNGAQVNLPANLYVGNLPDIDLSNNETIYNLTSASPVNSADLKIIKTARSGTVNAGAQQIFDVQIVNLGPVTSNSLTMTDVLGDLVNNTIGPSGGLVSVVVTRQGVASNVTCGGFFSGRAFNQSCTIASLPVCTENSNCPIITTTIRPGWFGGSRTNTATVSSSVTPDPVTTNNLSTVGFTVTEHADMTATKTATPSPVPAGAELVYTITARNDQNGLTRANNVTINDTLAPNLTFVSVVPSAGSCATTPVPGTVTAPTSNNQITCNLGTINLNTQQTVLVTVRPNQSYRGTNLSNTAVVSSSTGDPTPGNNSATVVTPVSNPSFDLLIGKTQSINPVTVGDTTVYTLTLQNSGLSAAENVTVTDTLPSSLLSYQSISAPGATCGTLPAVDAVGGAISCSYPFMTPGQTRTVQVTMKAVARGSVQNRADVSATESGPPNNFDTQQANNSAILTTTIRNRVDLSVTKIPSTGTPNFGEPFNFTVRVTNISGGLLGEADGVTLTDTLPAGMVLAGAPVPSVSNGTSTALSCTGAAGGTSFSCNFGTMSSGGIIDVVAPMRVVTLTSSPQTFTNTAIVTTTSGDETPGNNSGSGSVTVTEAGGVAVVKTASPTAINPAQVGNQITYTFQITNTGNVPLSGVTLTDPLVGMTPVDNWSVGTLAPGATATRSGTYLVIQDDLNAGQVVNQATATGQTPLGATISDLSGSTLTNNTPTVVPLTAVQGIAVVKTASPTAINPAQVGNQITYTFQITNTGNVPLTSVTLTDPLVGMTPVDNWSVGTLAPGATVTRSGTYLVTQANLNAGQVVNQATATGQTPLGATIGDLSGSSLTDNTPTVVPLTATPGIAVVKTASPTAINPAQVGDQITYTFQITNTGELTLTNVALTDPLPGMTPKSWSVGTLQPGVTATVSGTYRVKQTDIDAGEVENQATATGNPPTGPPVSDDSGSTLTDDTPTVVPLAGTPGIAVVKTASPTAINPAQVGDRITYRFQITNTGTVLLTNVTLSDPLPGLTVTGGPIAMLPPGATDTTTYTATYSVTEADISAGQVINQATVTANPPTGPPITDLSGATPGDDSKTVVLLANTPDVTATKTASTDRVIIGDSLTYTLTFTSNTPGTLRDVTVIDVLPPGLVYTPGTATAGGVAAEPQVTGRTLRWTGLTLSQTQPLVVRLGVRVTGAAPWGNLENQTWLNGAGGARFSNTATAVILLEPEAVFDCTDIIGKVFDDRNGNGTQDAPDGAGDSATEPGVPAVRVVTTRGYVITTDEFGRFHVPCADLPRDMGSNFTIKLDTRSLPAGFRVTTENPRTIRVTPGKMAKVNFGVSLTRVVRIDLSAQAFTAEGQPSLALKKGIAGLVAQLQSEPSVLRLTYKLSGESDASARKRLDRVETLIRSAWQDQGDGLRIERRLQRTGGTP